MLVADGWPDGLEAVRLLLVLLPYGSLGFDAQGVDGSEGPLHSIVAGVPLPEELWLGGLEDADEAVGEGLVLLCDFVLFDVGGGSEDGFFREGGDGGVVVDGGPDVPEAVVVVGLVLEVEEVF